MKLLHILEHVPDVEAGARNSTEQPRHGHREPREGRCYSDAPPFEEIAKRPGFTESGITTFLLDPHGKMPNMDLSRTEAADIAAYISRQR